MDRKQELKDCRKGVKVNEKEAKRLRDFWGYTLGYEFTVVPAGITSYDLIFTITSDKPREYGW